MILVKIAYHRLYPDVDNNDGNDGLIIAGTSGQCNGRRCDTAEKSFEFFPRVGPLRATGLEPYSRSERHEIVALYYT